MTFGLTTAGFVPKRLADIITEFEAAYRAQFGASVPLSPDTFLGQLVGIQSEREAELWELAEGLYQSMYPDSADGVPLDNAAALTGHSRHGPTRSTVTVTATGTPATVLPAGRIISVAVTGARFVTIDEAIIGGGGTVDIECEAEDTGPTEAPDTTLNVIVTPVSGWTSVTNAADAVVGRDRELDSAFRIRRYQNLVTSRGGTTPAIEARLREIDGVIFAGVAENRTGTTDGDSVPPHSIHAFVIGGTDQDIADVLWDSKPAGIQTYGGESETITDSFGNTQTMNWSRGTEVPIYLIVNITAGASYPVDGDDQVTALLVAYGSTLINGDDVVNWRLMAGMSAIPGITDLEILQGIAPTPTLTTNIAISATQLATIAEADITVNS